MKSSILIVLVSLILANDLLSQDSTSFRSRYYQLVEGSENSGRYQVMMGSDIDTT